MRYQLMPKPVARKGFTVVELLTTISIIAVLMALSVPALNYARTYGRRVLNSHHQREIVTAVTLYAFDNNGSYLPSVALCQLGSGSHRWQDPRKIHTTQPLWRMEHRSVAGYLADYIANPGVLFCPSSPEPYPFWEKVWQEGDQWDHPETADQGDPVFGSYCFYWNYVAYRPDGAPAFRGPTSNVGAPGESRMLVSDYFGADEWRRRSAFGSCEPMPNSEVVPASENASAYWAMDYEGDLESRKNIKLHLQAGFEDGHVARYHPTDTLVVEAAETADGRRPYWRGDERWSGSFFIPLQAVPLNERNP